MKTFKVSLIILIAMLSFSAYADYDSSTTYTVEVTQSSEQEEPYYIYDGPVKHRTPPRPTICTITPDGINIPSVDTAEITAYDIYDTEGGCIATFTTEHDFNSFIYSFNGTVEIRVHTDGYVFHGYVQL